MQAQQEAFNEPIDIENCAVADIKGFSQQVYEKFAELIVKECMEVVSKKCASPTAYNALAEHFGVEE